MKICILLTRKSVSISLDQSCRVVDLLNDLSGDGNRSNTDCCR